MSVLFQHAERTLPILFQLVSSHTQVRDMIAFATKVLERVAEWPCVTVDESGREVLLQVRIGIAAGPVASGVLGSAKKFTLISSTMNLASRLESNGAPMKIHCTEDVARRSGLDMSKMERRTIKVFYCTALHVHACTPPLLLSFSHF